MRKKKEEYTQKAQTSRIVATSRVSAKFKDTFYTLEYTEERTIPLDGTDVNLEKERQLLWDTVNDEVDYQMEQTLLQVQKEEQDKKRRN